MWIPVPSRALPMQTWKSVRTWIAQVCEAGLEPARPEWTLEPELDLDRYGMCRIVSPSTPQTVEKTSFFELFARKSSTRARCKKSTVRWMFVGCFYRRHPRKEF